MVFSLKGTSHIELCRLLKLKNWVESGGAAKSVIAARQVTVDGVVETRKRCKIQSGQTVSYDGVSVTITN